MAVSRDLLAKALAFAIAEAVESLRHGVSADEIAPRIRLEDEILNPGLVEQILRDAVLGPCLKYVEMYIHIYRHHHRDADFVTTLGASQTECLERCDDVADHCWAAPEHLPAFVASIKDHL